MRALGLVLIVTAMGCASADADERIELFAGDLPPSAGPTGTGGWQSVGWMGTDGWQRYPGRVTLVLHHDLGRVPTSALTYLSFEPDGGGAGLATGDLARVVEVTDTTVTIRNDTDAELYCRVVLQ